MTSFTKAKNPTKDSGTDLTNISDAGSTLVGYTLYFVMILVTFGAAAIVVRKGREQTGMDGGGFSIQGDF